MYVCMYVCMYVKEFDVHNSTISYPIHIIDKNFVMVIMDNKKKEFQRLKLLGSVRFICALSWLHAPLYIYISPQANYLCLYDFVRVTQIYTRLGVVLYTKLFCCLSCC